MSDPWAWTGTFGRTDQKLGRRACAVCGGTIPRRLGLWAIYCSQRCADADGAES